MSNDPIIPKNPSAIFVSHGGGPLPILGDPGHTEMVAHLRELAASIQRPSALVVVSAHWESPEIAITASASPPLIYDYYGFPPESYDLKYPAPGSPALAERIESLLKKSGVSARLDGERGFDHGLYIPLLLMYPDANIPCVQISLQSNLDPQEHIRVGSALSGLTADNILVLGSGFSFHNLKALMGGGSATLDPGNEAFETWLVDVCTDPDLDEGERADRLINWERAPSARYCHPREEHLLPLHVCYGVTGTRSTGHVGLSIMGKQSSTFFW